MDNYKTAFIAHTVTLAAGVAQEIVGTSTNRCAIILSSDATNEIDYGIGFTPAAGQGIVLHPNNAPMSLSSGDVGDGIQQSVSAVSAAGGTANVVEVVRIG